jgi:TetR/AcrR family tetracycline transcriptional repressor
LATKKSRENIQNKNILREPLNIEKIVQAALELLNEVGLQQLTTRRLAEALNIRSSSLYWHVRNKAELLQLLAESICGKLHLPDAGLSWEEQLFSFSMEYRNTLLSIRDSAEILLETPPLTQRRLQLMESMFGIFVNAGLPPKETVMASMLINDYVLSFVRNEMLMSNMSLSEKIINQEETDSTNLFHSLSPIQFPNIIRLTDYIVNQNMDEHFKYGLQIMFASLNESIKKC